MEFKILGPLEVREGGRRLTCTGPKQRLLLGVLLLHANEVVSSDRLTEALWGESPPETARKALQMHVSQLRRLLEPEREPGGSSRLLLTRPPGYELRVEEAQLDLHRFEQEVGEARAEAEAGRVQEAARGLRDALALWRGPPLSDLDSESFLRPDIARLEELRLAALEDRIDADLALGRRADVTGELERLVADHPLRERLRAQLMRALYRSGRQAEALAVYRDTRRVLVDTLGIEPSRELAELERAILAHDPALDLAVPDGRSTEAGGDEVRLRDDRRLPPVLARVAGRPFVARTAELARLRSAWESARAGDAGVVVLAGEPGIGKTSLAGTFARDVHADGATVILGRCHAEGLVPYEPFVEALRQLPAALVRAEAAELARVMPELSAGGSSSPQTEDSAARYLLFEAVTRTLASAAADAPLLFVLDDLHWAEPPTLLLWKHVARTMERLPILVLGTYRTTEADGTDRVVAALSDLGREVPVERVAIDGFDDAGVAELIGALYGRPPSPRLGSAMRRDTSGNPLFVSQLLRHFAEIEVLSDRGGQIVLVAEAGRLGVPESVKELVARRLAGFDQPTLGTLRTAAVIGRAFGHELVADIGPSEPEQVLDALESGTAAGLIEEVPGGRHAFVHALVRDAIYEQIGAARRARLHRRVAETLERRDGDPAQLALHFLAAGDIGKGVEHSVAAAERALGQLAHEDASGHYRRAVEALGDSDPARRCDLLLALGDAEARAGDTPRSKRAYRDAAEVAEARGMPHHLARAALGYGGRIIWEVSRDDPHLVPLLEQALSRLRGDDDLLRVRLLARLGGGPLRSAVFPRERSQGAAREALDLARRIAEPETLSYALAGYIAAHHSPDFTPRQPELATELIDLATRTGDRERAVEGHEHRGAARIELGDMRGAGEDLAAMAVLAEELRQPAQAWYVADIRAQHALLEGRLAEAESLVDEARGVGEQAQEWNASVSHHLQLYLLRRLQGRLAEVEDRLRRGADRYETYPLCRCALVQALAELGHESEASEGLAALCAEDLAAVPFDECWLVSVTLLAEAATALGDEERIAQLYRRLLPYAERVAVSTPEISLGSVSRYLGMLAAAAGCEQDAARHYEAAIKANAAIGARPWEALARGEYEALRRGIR